MNGQNYSTVDETGRKTVVVPVDFEAPAKEMVLHFVDNLADPLTLKLKFVEADKAAYDSKIAQELRQQRRENANITASTGADLVNVYFQPCCDKYEYTEILFHVPREYVTVGSPSGPVKKPSSWQLFKKCRVSSEDFYKSITGLAPGMYSYIVKQYDKKDELLMETEHIEFQIKKPQRPLW